MTKGEKKLNEVNPYRKIKVGGRTLFVDFSDLKLKLDKLVKEYNKKLKKGQH